MTVKPYDHEITDYFAELDAILKNTNHSLIAIGSFKEKLYGNRVKLALYSLLQMRL